MGFAPRLLVLQGLDEIEDFGSDRFRQLLEVLVNQFGMGHGVSPVARIY
jgi:hypothetical protein